MNNKEMEQDLSSDKRYHQWIDLTLASTDIEYIFFDPASSRVYKVYIRMGSSEWLYTVMLSYDNDDPDAWVQELNPFLRGGYMYEDLPALKIDIIRLLRERFPAVKSWNDGLLDHYNKPIRIYHSSPLYPDEFYNCFDYNMTKGDAPFILDVLGDIRLLRRAPYFRNRVAVIGSRKADEQGLDVAYRLGQYHSSEIVVSGLTLGIDTAAHQGCLDAGGRTVAVVGFGLDCINFEEKANLQARIISQGGMIVSERPDGTKESPKALMDSTRIQMAMADKVIVVQCERESITMRAIDFALRFHRPVFALDCDWSGNRYLIDNQIAKPFRM